MNFAVDYATLNGIKSRHFQMSPAKSSRWIALIVTALITCSGAHAQANDAVTVVFTREEVEPANFSSITPMGDLKAHPYDLTQVWAAVIFSDTEPPKETRFYKLEWKFLPTSGGEEVYDTAATNKYFLVKRRAEKETACWPIMKRIYLAQPGTHQLRVSTDKGVEVTVATFAVKP